MFLLRFLIRHIPKKNQLIVLNSNVLLDLNKNDIDVTDIYILNTLMQGPTEYKKDKELVIKELNKAHKEVLKLKNENIKLLQR